MKLFVNTNAFILLRKARFTRYIHIDNILKVANTTANKTANEIANKIEVAGRFSDVSC